MKIIITQEDISQGRRCSGWWCPIALAVSRVIPDKRVRVEKVMIKLFAPTVENDDNPPEKYIKLPNIAQNFIDDFDEERYVQPFEFELCMTT